MFYGCTGLASVTLPDSVTAIESSAFRGCTGLRSITIPKNVTVISGSVYGSAFSECTALLDVTIMATTPPSIYRDFEITGDTLHVPKGCMDAYKNSAWARDFTNIVEQQ
jgi:hypothetical protein